MFFSEHIQKMEIGLQVKMETIMFNIGVEKWMVIAIFFFGLFTISTSLLIQNIEQNIKLKKELEQEE